MNHSEGKTATRWRLLRDGPQSGAWNMAVDEAMLLAHARHLAPPTLRFYAWQPFCLSLGRLQKQWPAQLTDEAAEKERFDIVRRPTGGRAVWHAHEITYCVVVREELLPPGSRSVAGAYRWLSEGFLRGLQSLGLPVEMAPTGVRTNGSNCFAASAGCDFLADGKKLIGAAQCRREDAILQHGSLLLAVAQEQWQRLAGGPMTGATSLEELNPLLTAETVIKALTSSFQSVAGGSWESSKNAASVKEGLTEREIRLARCLFEGKYTRKSWTLDAQMAPETLERLEYALL